MDYMQKTVKAVCMNVEAKKIFLSDYYVPVQARSGHNRLKYFLNKRMIIIYYYSF